MRTPNVIADRIYAMPRRWSNTELRKFAHLFEGRVINVSAWKDEDKEGSKYKEYFTNAKTYTTSNYKEEARGLQHMPGEIYLDLTKDLSLNLRNKYNVVFNHTTLEHIYDFNRAFTNLCDLSNDIIIIVVPFLQKMHGIYGDYWRFSPQAVQKMCEDNKMSLIYCSFNNHQKTSVYIFIIASKNPDKWHHITNKAHSKYTGIYSKAMSQDKIGNKAIQNSTIKKIFFFVRDTINRF